MSAVATTATWLDRSCVLRTARKTHRCERQAYYNRLTEEGRGWYGATPCPEGGFIAAGTRYLEYLGEAAGYQSGKRYHLGCAGSFLVHGDQPTRHTGVCRLPYLDKQKVDPRACACGGELDRDYDEIEP